MSQVLDFAPGLLVDLNTSPAALHALIRARLVAAGWQVVSEDTSAVPCQLYVIPPSSETIGSSSARDVLLLRVGTASIDVIPVSQNLVTYPQVVCFYECDQAVIPGLKFGNNTVISGTNTGNPVSSLRTLYEALVASSDGYVSDWAWSWQPPATQNASDTHTYIFGRRKTLAVGDAAPTPTIIPLGSNDSTPSVFGGTAMVAAAPGFQPGAPYAPATSVAIDLSSGFLLFLQVCSRGLAIGARTSSAYNGLVHAIWGDHARALEAMPATVPGWEAWLSPIELIVGIDGAATGMTATGRTSHAWAVSSARVNWVNATHGATGTDRPAGSLYVHPIGGGDLRGIPHDVALPLVVGGGIQVTLTSGGVADNAEINTYGAYSIHRAKLQPSAMQLSFNGINMAAFWGPIETSDWLKYYGTAPDENTQLWPSPTPCATLATALARGGAEQTIALSTTAGLPTTGIARIESEWINWTGISGNSLTGCTRGSKATDLQAHAIGEQVYLGQYGIKINGGLIACGSTLPS